MAYCRWSSDDFTCDVYVYEDVNGGFTCHIAESRYVGDIPKVGPIPRPFTEDEGRAWIAARKAQSAWLSDAAHCPIELPHAGDTIRTETAEEMADELVRLKGLGYHVSSYAIDALREEAT